MKHIVSEILPEAMVLSGGGPQRRASTISGLQMPLSLPHLLQRGSTTAMALRNITRGDRANYSD